MVNHDAGSLGSIYNGAKVIAESRELIEVQAADEVSLLDSCTGFGAMLIFREVQNILRTGHPLEEVGSGIRHHDRNVFTDVPEIFGPPKRGAESVAVRTAVAEDDDVLCPLQDIEEFKDVSRRKKWRELHDILA